MTRGALRNLDLNLLVTLDALLTERNVTRAAQRLGISQPAVSVALRRLRRHFGDELLVRSGNRYELTQLAEQLREPTSVVLNGVQRVFDAVPDFDPATSERQFSLVVSDYAAAVLGRHLAAVVDEQAPHVRLRFLQQSLSTIEKAPESLRSVDGMVLPHGFVHDIPSVDLYEDRWVLLASHDNEEIGTTPGLDQLRSAPWVIFHDDRAAHTSAARQLSRLGIETDVHIVVQSFVPVPFLVAGSNRLAILPDELAVRLAESAGVRVLPVPWETAPLKEAFWWHPTHRSDPGHQWLREVLVEAGRRVMAGSRSADG